MTAYSGPQGRGAARRSRERRQDEAEARQATVSHERTRAHREGRCVNCSGITLLENIFGGAA